MRSARGLLVCGLALLVAGAAPGFGEEPAAPAAETVRARLDAIQGDLVELRFEKALAGIEALLGDTTMTEEERVEAWILRVQTHVAYGDLAAAEKDYEAILQRRPGYEPSPTLTPQKALKRFEKVRAAWVGQLAVELDPADALVSVDGNAVVVPPDGRLALVRGEHVVAARRAGHDPLERRVTVAPGTLETLRLELVPNARDVIVRTEPAGVEVLVDGRSMGITRRAEVAGGAATLEIENLPLGEHLFELRMECHRTERIRESLTVDLLDRSPRRLRVVRLAEERSTLVVRGQPEGAEVRLDGASIGPLPLRHAACPGERRLEVRAGGRIVWLSEQRLDAAVEHVVEIEPRPNLVLVGAERWPAALESFAAEFNTLGRLPAPSSAQLEAIEGWRRIDLPPDTDLGLGVVPSGRGGTGDRWYLYSPILRRAMRLDGAPAASAPAWSRIVWGFSTVDSRVGGALRVAEVYPGGPAAATGMAPGDRVASLGGRPVESSDVLQATLAVASPTAPIEIAWVDRASQPRSAALRGMRSPLLTPAAADSAGALVRAAWAVAHAAALPGSAASPLSNLALLFAANDQHALAVETLRRVRWGDRSGIGDGTTQYYLGCSLQALGQDAAALAAYTAAANTRATTFHDEGPPIAPAAQDHLTDLGHP